jgi:hypothetical protein
MFYSFHIVSRIKTESRLLALRTCDRCDVYVLAMWETVLVATGFLLF